LVCNDIVTEFPRSYTTSLEFASLIPLDDFEHTLFYDTNPRIVNLIRSKGLKFKLEGTQCGDTLAHATFAALNCFNLKLEPVWDFMDIPHKKLVSFCLVMHMMNLKFSVINVKTAFECIQIGEVKVPLPKRFVYVNRTTSFDVIMGRIENPTCNKVLAVVQSLSEEIENADYVTKHNLVLDACDLLNECIKLVYDNPEFDEAYIPTILKYVNSIDAINLLLILSVKKLIDIRSFKSVNRDFDRLVQFLPKQQVKNSRKV
jgi:hypothetical protein